MKDFICSSCSETWSVRDDKISLVKCCPFCAFEIPKPKEIIVTSFETAIQKVLNDLSVEVLKERKRFIAYLMDIGSQYQKEIHILSKTCDEKFFLKIYSFANLQSDELDIEFAKLHRLLVDEEGLSETWADFICKAFQSIFGCKKNNTQQIEESFPNIQNTRLKKTPTKEDIVWIKDFLKEKFSVEIGLNLKFGKIKDWKILDITENGILLLDENSNCRRAFNEICTLTTWKESSLRKWLNDSYLRENFSFEELDYILETQNKTKVDRCNEQITTERVFCLSDGELNKYKHLIKEQYGEWLLRSPSPISGPSFVMTCEKNEPYSWGVRVDYCADIKPAIFLSLDYFMKQFFSVN